MKNNQKRDEYMALSPFLFALSVPLFQFFAFQTAGMEALVLITLLISAFCLARIIIQIVSKFRALPTISPSPADKGLEDSLVMVIDQKLAESPVTARLSTFILRIDGFGAFIARHGQARAAIKENEIEARLHHQLRTGDHLERLAPGLFFGLINSEKALTTASMLRISKRLQQTTMVSFASNTLQNRVSASVGFCLGNRLAEPSGENLLRAAQSAVEHAKSLGPGSVFAYPAQVACNDELSNEILVALETGQIEPWYQPQINTKTRAITGVEALVRWQHPNRGLLNPEEFLDALKSVGLTSKLTQLLIDTVTRDLAKWDRAGLHIPKAGINFSADDLTDPTLIERLKWALELNDLSANRITVEILETVGGHPEINTIAKRLSQIKKLGCHIDLDDFGTGHSLPAIAKKLCVDRIKIDKSFVLGAPNDPKKREILAQFRKIAASLKIAVLAEGVENDDENNLMTELGFEDLQGFDIAKPLLSPNLVKWARQHQAKQRPSAARNTRELLGHSKQG